MIVLPIIKISQFTQPDNPKPLKDLKGVSACYAQWSDGPKQKEHLY